MTWATSVPILVFLGVSVLDLALMYATDRQTDVRQKHCLMLPPIRGVVHNKYMFTLILQKECIHQISVHHC